MIEIIKTTNNGGKKPKIVSQLISGYSVDQIKHELLEHLHEQTKALYRQCGWGATDTKIVTEKLDVCTKTTITYTFEPVITIYSKFTEILEIIS